MNQMEMGDAAGNSVSMDDAPQSGVLRLRLDREVKIMNPPEEEVALQYRRITR